MSDNARHLTLRAAQQDSLLRRAVSDINPSTPRASEGVEMTSFAPQRHSFDSAAESTGNPRDSDHQRPIHMEIGEALSMPPEARLALPGDRKRELHGAGGTSAIKAAKSTSATVIEMKAKPRNAAQKALRDMFENPIETRFGVAYTLTNFLFIVASTMALCAETFPDNYNRNVARWRVTEIVSVAFFTMDYALRLYAYAGAWRRFFTNTMNVIDLLSIMPFYIELFTQVAGEEVPEDFALLRILRVTRISRVFAVSKYLKGLHAFSHALYRSKEGLELLGFFVIITLILFSAAIYYAERGTYDYSLRLWVREDGELSPFGSIPAAFWWCITTLTSVGYGDVVPITFWGKFVGSLTMIAGIFVIAIPTAVVGSHFMDEWRKASARSSRQRAEDASTPSLQSKSESMREVVDLFVLMQETLVALGMTNKNLRASLADVRDWHLSANKSTGPDGDDGLGWSSWPRALDGPAQQVKTILHTDAVRLRSMHASVATARDFLAVVSSKRASAVSEGLQVAGPSWDVVDRHSGDSAGGVVTTADDDALEDIELPAVALAAAQQITALQQGSVDREARSSRRRSGRKPRVSSRADMSAMPSSVDSQENQDDGGPAPVETVDASPRGGRHVSVLARQFI